MLDPTRFDALYADAYQRLLHQTYALTGDQRASQLAVRDAFISTWHHWPKVSRTADPERWTRPIAWTNAHRRHGARMWHRDKSTGTEQAATLDALGKLTSPQRRMLVLAHLTSGSMEEIAREAGLPLSEAEHTLQTATAAFATHREIESTAVRTALEELATPLEALRPPRVTIIRRAGTARRRTYTGLGVAVGLAALLVSGVAVHADDGVQPRLTHQVTSASPSPTGPETPTPAPAELSPDALLAADQVTRVAPTMTWRIASTSENTQGKGKVLPCQTARFADPHAEGFLVRTFTAKPKRDAGSGTAEGQSQPKQQATAIQTAELSDDPRRARATYRTTRAWFTGCSTGRTYLERIGRVDGVGDQATAFVMRSWDGGPPAMLVGVARTGQVTTTTVARFATPTPNVRAGLTLLAAAVNAQCGQPATGHCAGPPTMTEVPPPPTGSVPGMLSEVDLPPVTGMTERWVGTEPKRAISNPAATQCDRAVFSQPPMAVAFSRTFLVPRADLPATFGLTQTVGTLPAPKATAFVAEVRTRITKCPDKQLGTKVARLAQHSDSHSDLSVWRLTVEVSDKRDVTYLMGITRSGTAVGQVGFIPAPHATMSTTDFIALVERAQQRLAKLPKPGR